jgi:hypothetical protein
VSIKLFFLLFLLDSFLIASNCFSYSLRSVAFSSTVLLNSAISDLFSFFFVLAPGLFLASILAPGLFLASILSPISFLAYDFGFDSEIVSARAKTIAPIAFSINVFLSLFLSCGFGSFTVIPRASLSRPSPFFRGWCRGIRR